MATEAKPTRLGNLPLPKAEVFDAEVVAALRGLQNTITCFQTRFANNVLIYLDNLEVARTLGSLVNTSSQQAFTQFQEVEKAWQARKRLPHMSKGKVIIRWVPGHAGIAGNEKADQEAKTAAAKVAGSPTAQDIPSTLAYIRRQVKEQATQAFQDYWVQNVPKRYTDLEIPLQKASIEKKLPRFTLRKLYASHTGHGDFADYHIRLSHTDAELHCLCRHRKTPEHFFYYRLARRAATRRRQPTYNLREILATARSAQEFNSWLNKTRFYKEICPMYWPTVTLQPDSPIPPSTPSHPAFPQTQP
ncbi:hypothetical protein VTO42DRAFT_3037 [Malbranchea cinnamomea]